jgi:hypothetical protein
MAKVGSLHQNCPAAIVAYEFPMREKRIRTMWVSAWLRENRSRGLASGFLSSAILCID